MDVVYNPLSTRLVQSARKLGLPAEGGLYMLCAQAVYAAGRFFDREIDDSRIEGIYRSVLREKRTVVLIGNALLRQDHRGSLGRTEVKTPLP